jgi:hypothetical protein
MSDGTPDSVKHEALSVCEASFLRAVQRPGRIIQSGSWMEFQNIPKSNTHLF